MAEHGTSRRYRTGCRCDPCRKANRDYQLAWAAKKAEAAGVPHGLNGYDNFGCRCDVCKAARAKWSASRQRRNNALVSKRRARRGAGQEPTPESFAHGIFGYREWNCRCDICATAAREAHRRNQRRAKAKAGTPTKKWQLWTGAELEVVAQHSGMSAVDLAKMLGRTQRGVQWARTLLREHPARQQIAGLSRHTELTTAR